MRTELSILLLMIILSSCSDSGFKFIKLENIQLLESNSEGLMLIQEKAEPGQMKMEGKVGYVNSAGEIVIKPQFSRVTICSFKEGKACAAPFARAFDLPPKRGYIDKTGKFVIAPKFDDAESFSEGLAAVKIDDKWGYIDTRGIQQISPQYDEVEKFSEGLAAVKFNGKWGFINKNGEIVIEAKYESVNNFSEELAFVNIEKNGETICIDKKGKKIFSGSYERIGGFKNNRTYALEGKKWSIIDNQGRAITTLPKEVLNVLTEYQEGLAVVYGTNKKCGAINEQGKISIPLNYDSCSFDGFSEGLLSIEQNEKSGIINTKGELILKPKYSFIGDFHNGVAVAKEGEQWGILKKL